MFINHHVIKNLNLIKKGDYSKVELHNIWKPLLLVEDIDANELRKSREQGGLLPLSGALLKHEQDVERLAEYARIQRR